VTAPGLELRSITSRASTIQSRMPFLAYRSNRHRPPVLKEKSPNNSRQKYSELIEDAEMMLHATVNSSYHYLLDEPQLMDCFLLHPTFDDDDRHPLDCRTICRYQAQDQTLMDADATQPKLLMKSSSSARTWNSYALETRKELLWTIGKSPYPTQCSTSSSTGTIFLLRMLA
jgi:hypothetical protein